MAVANEQLFLQVDAGVELLRKNLQQGEGTLAQFEQRAGKMADTVDRTLAGMGKMFGPFQAAAEASAAAVTKAYDTSFSDLQRLAAKVVIGDNGQVSLGAAQAREAASAAQQQVTVLTALKSMYERTAAGEQTLTLATQQNIVAATAAVAQAERHAASLLRQAGALEQVEIEMTQAGAGAQAYAGKQGQLTTQSGAQRAGLQQLSFQLGDVAQQFTAGTPVMTIFAQQSGQVIQAVSLMTTKTTGLLAILGSPWTQIIGAAAVVLAPLVAKLFEGDDALADAIDKLRKDADATELNRKAKEAFTHTIIGQIEAQRELNDEIERSIRTQRQQQQFTAYRAQTLVAEHRESRPGLAQEVSRQEGVVADYQRRADAFKPGTSSFGATAARTRLATEIEKLAELKRQLAGLDASIVSGERAVRSAQQSLIQNDVEASFDKKAAAALRYTKQLGLLNVQQAIGAGRTGQTNQMQSDGSYRKVTVRGIGNDEYQRELLRITGERDRANRAAESASRTATRSSAQVFADFERELRERGVQRAAGRTGLRSAADQNEIYRAGDSPLDGYRRVSRHQSYQAFDPSRATANDQAAYAAAQAAGLKGFRIVNESRGRKHYEWTGAGKRGDVDVAGSDAATRRQGSDARRVEAARVAVLKDDTAYSEQERQARHRLLEATRKNAASEEERDRLLRDDINAEADAQKRKIANQVAAKEIDQTQAEYLGRLNEATRAQRLQNVSVERASATVRDAGAARSRTIDEQLAGLQIEQDLAKTQKDRRSVELRILALQEQRERILQQAVLDDPKSSEADRASATSALRAVDTQHDGRVSQIEERTAGPWEQYLSQMRDGMGQTGEALERAAVNGLDRFNDKLASTASKILKIGGAFGDIADQIIADLIRIAIQEAATAIFGGGGGGSSAAVAGGGASAGGIDLGGLLSGVGFFADGGDPPVGRVSVVGERGPELFVPKVAGTIIPNGQSLRLPQLPSAGAMRSRGSSLSVSMPVSISAAGADPAALARVEQAVDRLRIDMPGTIIATVSNAQERGVLQR